MVETFKFGDIIENGYASTDNPNRIGVFIRYASIPRGRINAGRYLECRSDNGNFWKTDVGNDKLQKLGSIFGDKDARIAALEAQLAETERSADHWLGEARRLLKAGQNAAYSLEATPPAPKVTERKDPAAIRAHADRVLERMNQTPYNPKRKLLATQHVNLTNEALRAEGWNAALTAAQEAGKP